MTRRGQLIRPRDGLLERHLASWLGVWPPRRPIDVVGSVARTRPGWDGDVRRLVGVSAPTLGTVLSVPPEQVDVVEEAIAGGGAAGEDPAAALSVPSIGRAVAAALEAGDAHLGRGVFRAAEAVPGRDVLPDLGQWVDADDPRVPEWLLPFNGGVLLHLRDDGTYGAGVGLKAHDDLGREISVGTADDLRGHGLAKRLVARAARDVIAAGRVPTYLHGPDNTASARVADATGFPDRGWSVWGLFGG